ncbi:heme peroxidase [Atractiella rhizophila]|nr:heme peroxidase [Atractiella rhizophila]
MATFNVDDGTGGIDYSIGFELDRPENVGQGQINALGDYKSTASPYISMADMIALGVVLTGVGCGGDMPMIPYRMGRIDSYAAGREGVPQPHEPLDKHIESFRQQGFNATEMIQLVACGHSIGALRGIDFPGITAKGNFPPFDTTEGLFDNKIGTEYLAGTTKNPLVVAPNETFRSDARIFSSDGNATIEALSSSSSTFTNTCAGLFERMINTVPRDVTLSEPLEPIEYKVDTTLFEVSGESLLLKTGLRILKPTSDGRVVTLYWQERTGTPCSRETCSSKAISSSSVSSIIFTKLQLAPQRYLFESPIDATQGIAKFWFEIEEGGETSIVDNNGCGYNFANSEDLFFYDRSRSFDNFGRFLVAAVHESVSPTKVTVQTYTLTGQTVPLVREYTMLLDTTLPNSLGYSFYSVKVPFDSSVSSFDQFTLHAETTERMYDTEWLPAGMVDFS